MSCPYKPTGLLSLGRPHLFTPRRSTVNSIGWAGTKASHPYCAVKPALTQPHLPVIPETLPLPPRGSGRAEAAGLLTFAVLPIPGEARLADALVGPGGVLTDGVNVAIVGSLNTFIDICGGGGGDEVTLQIPAPA